jgi:predicted permease
MKPCFLIIQNVNIFLGSIALLLCALIICYIIWKNTPDESKGEALFLIGIAAITVFGNIIYLAT